MNIYLYAGGRRMVAKSGIGQALAHQEAILPMAGLTLTDSLLQADVVQINTVFPDSAAVAILARLLGKRVVCYGHSTMEDFRGSFRGSGWLAPLFRRWITFCYSLGHIVLTPTPYSAALLQGYGILRPIRPLSNGVDTDFFAPDPALRQSFRQRYGIAEGEKAVISVGHTIARKGLLDFLELARRMPEVRFLWFGYTDPHLLPPEINRAMENAPSNVTFAGYVDQAVLREAYCGADAFAFLTHEETEGIVVLEALACGTPLLLRDIPVYEGWLRHGRDVWKGNGPEDFTRLLRGMLDSTLPDLTVAGRHTAQARSFRSVAAMARSIYVRPASLPLQDQALPSGQRQA